MRFELSSKSRLTCRAATFGYPPAQPAVERTGSPTVIFENKVQPRHHEGREPDVSNPWYRRVVGRYPLFRAPVTIRRRPHSFLAFCIVVRVVGGLTRLAPPQILIQFKRILDGDVQAQSGSSKSEQQMEGCAELLLRSACMRVGCVGQSAG